MDNEDSANEVAADNNTSRVRARMITPLNCVLGEQRDAKQPLVVVTLGEANGTTDVIAILPEDAQRLERMIEQTLPDDVCDGQKVEQRRQQALRSQVARSSRVIRVLGEKEYLRELRMNFPALASYVERQIRSITGSVRTHTSSPAAAKKIRQRLALSMLVVVDVTRWSAGMLQGREDGL